MKLQRKLSSKSLGDQRTRRQWYCKVLKNTTLCRSSVENSPGEHLAEKPNEMLADGGLVICYVFI